MYSLNFSLAWLLSSITESMFAEFLVGILIELHVSGVRRIVVGFPAAKGQG